MLGLHANSAERAFAGLKPFSICGCRNPQCARISSDHNTQIRPYSAHIDSLVSACTSTTSTPLFMLYNALLHFVIIQRS
jgi:hypothetical protein